MRGLMRRPPSLHAVVDRSAVEHGNDVDTGCRAFSPPAGAAYRRSRQAAKSPGTWRRRVPFNRVTVLSITMAVAVQLSSCGGNVTPAWPKTIVVSVESLNSDNPNHIVDSNISFVNALFEEYLPPDEVPVDALRSYYVDYYLTQVENGGFSQFVFNSRWDSKVVQLVEDGLRLMNANQHTLSFQQNAVLVRQLGPDGLKDFLQSEYFDENPERDALDRNNSLFFELSKEEDLVVLNAAWLKSLPNVIALEKDEIAEEIKRRAALVPDREQRAAAARAGEPRYMKLIRALSERAGQTLSHITAGDPTHMHAGQRTLAWHFITDNGHHYMVEADRKSLMFNGETHELIMEIDAPLE